MIGQEKLQEKLNKYTLNSLPKALLFIGQDGCGKHTLVTQLAERLELELVQINENVSADDLIDYQQCPIKKLYLINLKLFTEKQQNQFLKFIEEPSNTVYICLIAESETGILPTILNRCIKYIFEPYTIEQLKQIKMFDNNIIYDVCTTPGQLAIADNESIKKLYLLCKNLVQDCNTIGFESLISTTALINYKEDYNKFDFELFFNMLAHCAFEDYLSTNSQQSFKVYLHTVLFKQEKINKNIVKENFILNYLTQLYLKLKEIYN